MILRGALEQGRFFVAGLYLALLAVIFIGMAATMTRMAQGTAPGAPATREDRLAILPPLALCLLVLLLGVYLPPPLDEALHRAAAALGSG